MKSQVFKYLLLCIWRARIPSLVASCAINHIAEDMTKLNLFGLFGRIRLATHHHTRSTSMQAFALVEFPTLCVVRIAYWTSA